MTTETRQRIRAYKKALPELRERVIAVALLLAMSVSMLASASFAWITLSSAPEATGMQTTVAANGNLEIALAQGSTSSAAVAPGESQVGDSSAAEEQTIVGANVTWGNLVNVSDPTYGLSQIALRPALLSAYNRTEYPLNGATYGGDGRVVSTNDRYEYASYTQNEVDGTYYFAAGSKANYGVRAISSVAYENVTGNARIDNYRNDTNQLYMDAQNFYKKVVSDEANDVNTLDAASGVTCISALEGLVTVFAQDKINEMGMGYGTTTQTSCSPYLWYLYQMMLLLEDAMEMEGKAILEMANWQAYIASGDAKTENTFASIEELMGYTTAQLSEKGVKIDTLADYKNCLNTLRNNCIDALYPMAVKCQNPDAPEQDYYWDDISTIVNNLVHLNSATLNGIPLSQLGSDDIGDILGSSENERHPVVVHGGLMLDIEERFVTNDCRVQADVEVTVYAKVSFMAMDVTVYGTVYTEAYTTGYEPDYTADMAYTESLQSGAKGDAVAKDTYGLAIDLWVRTNYPDAVLTLEGSAKYEDQRATATIEGTTYELYTMTVGEGDTQTTVDVYKKTVDGAEAWYYLSTNTEVPEEEQGTFAEKYIAVIVGYEGENRVWEDWRELLENGYIEQDATTQGAGSCFVFYADTPTEQAKIKEMLEAFNVAFIDQKGNILGTAKLNMDSAYENQGKVTVPLEVDTGVDYTDDSGKVQKGLAILTQNEPTMITAIVYLNGSKLQNENVLAEGELQGQLNIQFGTSTTLIAPDNEELQQQARTITAKVAIGGYEGTDGYIGPSDGFEYQDGGYPTTVTLTIDGDQPERISGFFVRVINSTQGTRGDELTFKINEDGTWTATTTLTNPGLYAFNTLIVDGVQYTLHDGSEQSGMNTYYEANRPYVRIGGLKITSASVGVEPGTYMTADSSKNFPVTVKVDSAVEPKQVNAQFFNADNTKQYTAILTYDSANDQWVGAANISSSDTYTLKYISVDGQILDAPSTGSYTLYLGLTARVSTTVPAADRTYVYTGAKVQLPMRVYIYDDAYNLIPNLTGMELHYTNMLSPAPMTWNGSYYEGVLEATNAGAMSFKEIKLGSIGTITNVSGAPVFEATQVEPVSYVVGSGTVHFGEKVVIGDATPDYMEVEFVNGQTADVWAVMTNEEAGRTDIIAGARKDENDQNKLTFYVPTDVDGEWVLTKLMLQDCYDDQGNHYPLTDNTPTEEDSLVFTLSDEEQAVMRSKIYATYNVAVTIDGATYENTSKTVTINLTPDEPGTFLEGHDTGDITVAVTNYEGNPFATNQVSAAVLEIQHDKDTTAPYGNYTGASGDKINFTPTIAENGTVTFAGQTLNHAGEYNTNTFTVTIGGKVVDIVVKPKYTITSASPTVTVSSVSPTGEIEVYTATRASDGETEWGYRASGSFNRKIDDFNAVVYIYSGSTLPYNVYAPSVTLQISGMPSSDFTASMTFANQYDSSYDATYSFTANNQTKAASIGGGTNGGLMSNVHIYPAGKQTVNTMDVTYGGQNLRVTLSNPVTINQPQYPPYVDFVVDDDYLTTPSRIYGTPQADGTFTVTLPTVANATSDESSTVDGEFAAVGQPATRTVYTETYNSISCSGVLYDYVRYTESKVTYQAVSSETTWKNTHAVTGWDVYGGKKPGDTIEITGNMTISADVTVTEGTKSTDTVTATYYTYTYTQTASASKKTSVPSGYGTKVDSATNYTTETTYE